jgi:hypothetical protein
MSRNRCEGHHSNGTKQGLIMAIGLYFRDIQSQRTTAGGDVRTGACGRLAGRRDEWE